MKLLVFILFLTTNNLWAQYSLGAKNEATGANAAMAQNEWAIHGNSAGISSVVSNAKIALDYSQSFISREIKTSAGVIVLPMKKKYFIGFGFQKYGIDVYQDLKLAFTYAQKFGKLALAINQNYHQLNVPQYFNKKGYSIDAGANYTYNQKLVLGAYIQNVSNLGYFNDFNKFPAVAGIGAQWLIDQSVHINLGVYQPLYSVLATSLRIGTNYALHEKLDIRAGIVSSPFAYYGGIGVKSSKFNLDLAYRQQVVLGGQPQISLSYAL